jgi:hypothetical protein
MAHEVMIARYLGLVMSTERALADAFVLVGARHATEPEMLNAARLHSNWCSGHLDVLRPAAAGYGAEGTRQGERMRRALFRGRRLGGFGLLRDLHDLLTLATSVHACWMALLQAAREARDAHLEKACRACDAETLRQISWLETKLRQAAPQALTVPVSPARQAGASIPSLSQLRALADLLPGPAVRAALPPVTVVVGGLVAVLAFMLARASASVDQGR